MKNHQLSVIMGVHVQFSVIKPFVKFKVNTNHKIAPISFLIADEFCNTLRNVNYYSSFKIYLVLMLFTRDNIVHDI